MKILYLSSMFDYKTYGELFIKEKKPLHAANKFHSLFCKGLAKHGHIVEAYSILPINRENCDKKYICVPPVLQDGYTINYAPSFNLPVLRHLHLMVCAFFKTLCAPKDTVLVWDVLTVSASFGAVLGARASGKKTVGIVTDLPQFMEVGEVGWMCKLNNYLMGLADGFVLLTQQMNDVANLKGKPYRIIEGLVDPTMAVVECSTVKETKKVLYAGSLMQIYGIRNLCEAFLSCAIPGEELHIYGDGDYADQIRQISHPGIVYHGNRPNQEVVEAELEATLLVNPRPSEGEYTKYSFPSKTLEYMVSGTPVLTAKLAGIPDSYDPYLFYFDGTQESLAKSLRTLLDRPSAELTDFGQKAKAFALDKKSCDYQAGQLLDLLKEL